MDEEKTANSFEMPEFKTDTSSEVPVFRSTPLTPEEIAAKEAAEKEAKEKEAAIEAATEPAEEPAIEPIEEPTKESTTESAEETTIESDDELAEESAGEPAMPTVEEIEDIPAPAEAEIEPVETSVEDSIDLSPEDSIEMIVEGEDEVATSVPEKPQTKIVDVPANEEAPAFKDNFAEEQKNKKRKKIIILSSIAAVLVAGIATLLYWMFVVAPAVTVTIKIKPKTEKFSEIMRFTSKKDAASIEDGLFALGELQDKDTSMVELTPSGERNEGKNASGKVTLFIIPMSIEQEYTIPADAILTAGTLEYKVAADVSISNTSTCDPNEAKKTADEAKNKGGITDTVACPILIRDVQVNAANPGTKYNIGAKKANEWQEYRTNSFVAKIYNEGAFTGGTDKIVKVLEQSDVDTAKVKLKPKDDYESTLIEAATGDQLMIPSSFTIESDEMKVTPEVGKALADGQKAMISQDNTYKMKFANTEDLNEYINNYALKKLASDQKIYEISDLVIKGFNDQNTPYTAKVQAQIKTGPSITTEQVIEQIKGRKIGEVRTLLASINGIKDVDVRVSYAWVSTIPENNDKITIKIEMEE